MESKNMKIAILSMQRVINYGSVLQAYSLKELIQELTKNEVQFIDIDHIKYMGQMAVRLQLKQLQKFLQK